MPVPDVIETYHNPAYVNSESRFIFTNIALEQTFYIKVYCGSDLVSCFLLPAGANVSIYVPAGAYSLKQSHGEHWFGDNDLFGNDGYYYDLTFENQPDPRYVVLWANYYCSIYVDTSDGGNTPFSNMTQDPSQW